ncbi:MAG: tetratricopeptide repeat protein [Myxococcales bacterium]|nr:tetratricopeptide repeat protein [Myxococcales bacterium]
MLRLLLILETVLLVAGALLFAVAVPRRPASDPPRSALRAPEEPPSATGTVAEGALPPPLVRCFPGDTSGAPPRPLGEVLGRAADRFDAGDYAGSLGCAEEAARTDPRSPSAHHDRAAALLELGRFDEARDAFARALALDPDDPETLAGGADLYVNRLPSSVDHSETGLELARRGAHRLKRSQDRTLAARLALLEGQALNDLGRSRDALARLDAASALVPARTADAQRVGYERSTALFELCRFGDARQGFQAVLAESSDDAWAHHHLALTLERTGDPEGAARAFAAAIRLAPGDFKPEVIVPAAEFRALVDAEAGRLPPPLRADLANVHLETADLPDLTDLTAEEPPLSPTILGLFRGAPLGDPAADPADPRAIVLYRKNLARAVASREELALQIRTTLLHELGHLRGEDDEALRARGLQ